MCMGRSSSKRSAKVATRGRRRMRGRVVAAKPADIRGQIPGRNVRAFAPSPTGSTDSAAPQAAAGLQTYRRWAGFAAGPQDGDFGFGAYFTDERGLADNEPSGSSMTAYTWTPAGAR
jgi:hypothetical protein